ncbi:putative quinol monooxygenase [Hafnia paralvei]|uniref:ABM domain-containing protein n=1 Tax=Hafnia paralvei TaxID=546367 RepID=A0A4Q9ENJ1_9GAMM|nr:antibiotic biosynthesis monooxygenase [Hafnia paralvei]TBM28330.1 hypothetical protein EYY89_09080 [Hafnia paralvei]
MSLYIKADVIINGSLPVDLREHANELVMCSRKELGCLEYNAFVQDSGLLFIEGWTNHEALKTHEKIEHFTRFIHVINKMKTDVKITELEII